MRGARKGRIDVPRRYWQRWHTPPCFLNPK